MQIKVLGCSGGIGGGARTSAMLVDDDVLLDAGTGVGDLSLQQMRSIRHVLLTHAHLDHIAGLPFLIDSIFDARIGDPLIVYGRHETLATLQKHIFNWEIWPDFAQLPDVQNPVVRYQPLEPGEMVDIHGRLFHAVDVRHTVPAQGYCVSHEDGVFAISGDTTTNTTLWPLLNSLPDLKALVVEVSFPDEQAALAQAAGHYCPRTLAADLIKLDHQPDIWLTAMKPGEEALILTQVKDQIPKRDVRMLSTGASLTI
ncbi:MAG: 3',5'-cyclic-nucleotide phosphodiesterase [Pseudomonadota bacterium]